MRARIAAPAVLLAVAAMAGGAGPASALTRAQADAIAVRVLKPSRDPGAAILFRLPAPLGARDAVFEAVTDTPTKVVTVRTIGRRAWLYWLDSEPFALFQHPSRMLLVDDATGRVLLNRALTWYPLVNGRRAAFLASTAAYGNATRYWVASKGLPTGTPRRHPVLDVVTPPNAFASDCLLMAGDYHEPLIARNFPALERWARSVGLKARYARAGTDPLGTQPQPKGQNGPTGSSLKRSVRRIVAEGCKDVFLYVGGHGSKAAPGVPPQGLTTAGGRRFITARNIREMLEENPDVTFKIKIESCFSGRFRDELVNGDGSPRSSNMLVLETSSGATEPSYGALRRLQRQPNGNERLVPRPNNPSGYSEFFNGNITGLTSVVQDQTAIDGFVGQGGSLLARVIEQSFTAGAGNDEARSIGKTHPQLLARIPGTVPTVTDVLTSWTHPPLAQNMGFSWFCVRLKTTPGAEVDVAVMGPSASDPPRGSRVTAGADGTAIASFQITAAGTWLVSSIQAHANGQTAAGPAVPPTTVPPPPMTPGGSQGPFACPAKTPPPALP
jgi:hypothetical protein